MRYFPTLSPTLLSLRGKIFSNLKENHVLQFNFHFWLLMKRNTFLCIFWATRYLFSCWNKWDYIFLPFLFSIASNGTCGFSVFSSSVKEFLQMQCQTNLDQWNEHNSGKLHRTYYFFFLCGHRYFDEHKETLSGFHSSKLAISPGVRWVEISSSPISRSTFEENQGKKSLGSPKVSHLW